MATPIPKRIKLRNNLQQPLSEAAIVEATIAFANGATLELVDLFDPHEDVFDREEAAVAGFESSVTEPCIGDKSIEKRAARVAQATGTVPMSVTQYREHHREQLRENLRYRVIEPLLPEDADGMENIGLFPAIVPKAYARRTPRGGLTFSIFYSFATDLDLATLGYFLLEDTERPFGSKLCQCELESCGIFFVEVKPQRGRPQRRYCCAAHRISAHEGNAGNRMKASREKRRRLQLAKIRRHK